MMKENRLRYLLDNNLPSVGTRIFSRWPMVVETIGTLGIFDYVEFLAEYAPFTQDDLENIVRAAELHNMGSMIKVDYQNKEYVTQKAFASGFQSVLFTDFRTGKEIEEALKWISSEHPQDGGRMGYPLRRWIGCQLLPDAEAFSQMVRQTVKCFMIEKKEAMENIDEICSVPGVDMIQFGPYDYSLSRGWKVSEHREELKEIEFKMIETALKHGVHPRCELNDVKDATVYVNLGVKHFNLGVELLILKNFLGEQGTTLRKLLG